MDSIPRTIMSLFVFQVRQDRVCEGLIPCPFYTVIQTVYVSTVRAMTNPIGCLLPLPSQ